MPNQTKIAIYEPGNLLKRRILSLRLKPQLKNEYSTYIQPAKVLVISGTNGSYSKLTQLLVDFGVISGEQHWLFGDNHLVIHGNCLDKADEMVECLWFIYSLEEKALKKGGHIHYLLGEKEMLHINGEWRYQQPNYAISKKVRGKQFSILYDGNNELWRWLRTKNMVEKIGNTLFLPHPMLFYLCATHCTIPELNNKVRDRINHFCNENPSSLFYYKSPTFDIQELRGVLDFYGAKKIITNQADILQTSSHFTESVFTLNTNTPEALLITKEKFFSLSAKGEAKEL